MARRAIAVQAGAPLHADELPVDEELVRRMVSAQLPGYARLEEGPVRDDEVVDVTAVEEVYAG